MLSLLVALAGVSPASNALVTNEDRTGSSSSHYTSKTPYAPQQDLADYQLPPPGFVPVFTQHVARHGSRGLSSRKYDDLSLQVGEAAEASGSLTPIGRELGPQIRSLIQAHERLGYGNLSRLGIEERRAMAMRVHKRLPQLFEAMKADGRRIEIVSSGKDRAVDSGTNFAEGLVAADPALKPLIAPERADKDLLYFHNADINADYQACLDTDTRLASVQQMLEGLERTRAVSRRMLKEFTRPRSSTGSRPAGSPLSMEARARRGWPTQWMRH